MWSRFVKVRKNTFLWLQTTETGDKFAVTTLAHAGLTLGDGRASAQNGAAGRPDIKYAHSRISQHTAKLCRGALKALKHCIAYCKETQYWCFRQTANGKDVGGRFYSDSGHAGNAEIQNER